MTELFITLHKNELRTDSRLLASFLDHRHRTILENIDKYLGHLNELSEVPFETEAGEVRTQGGKSVSRYALLTEDQCYFLLTLMRNNERVVNAKLALVKAFRDARTQLAQRDLARVDGKQIRRLETDAIKNLVEYAKAKGSKSAERYYANVTKMTNNLLGIDAGERSNLDARTLTDIGVMEKIVANAISDGISSDLPYKDIYQLAKNRCKVALPALGIEA